MGAKGEPKIGSKCCADHLGAHRGDLRHWFCFWCLFCRPPTFPAHLERILISSTSLVTVAHHPCVIDRTRNLIHSPSWDRQAVLSVQLELLTRETFWCGKTTMSRSGSRGMCS